ncbi:MAG: TolC family protein [Pseudomonadota bacterium]
MPIPTLGRAIGSALLSTAAVATLPSALAAQPASEGPANSVSPSGLTLEAAIRRALSAAPQTAVASARRESLTAAREEAGLRPQPSAGLTVENFGPPMGDLYDQLQITGTYSQRIERGGKRQARVDLVSRDIDVAAAEAIVARLDLIKTVQQGFVEIQAAEAASAVARERVRIASELEREVGKRVASARDPIFAGTRARTAATAARVDLELAVHARDAAIKRLAMFWGGPPQAPATSAAGFLDLQAAEVSGAPPSPDLAVIEARIARARAAIDLQRANAARDLTVSAGPRIISTRAIGAVAGVSMPLGGRRLAQARIAGAEAERRRAEAELAVERHARERAITLAAERVEQARREAISIRDEVIPSADRTLEQVRFGYNRGFFSFADVSAAQTIAIDARSRVVDAARRYHQARAELDRLTGRFTDLAREGIQ